MISLIISFCKKINGNSGIDREHFTGEFSKEQRDGFGNMAKNSVGSDTQDTKEHSGQEKKA